MFDPFAGALFIKSMSLTELWHIVHHHAADWPSLPTGGSKIVYHRDRVDQEDLDTLTALQGVEAQRWSALCSAAGWTVYGAVALSWCEGAKLEDVWKGWLASGFPLKPLPEYERPARFINPALLSDATSIEGINQWSIDQKYPDLETHALAVCATIAALKSPPIFGLPPEQYAHAAPQIAAFLKSRLLQKPALAPQERNLVGILGQKIKGTEWDVWNEEKL